MRGGAAWARTLHRSERVSTDMPMTVAPCALTRSSELNARSVKALTTRDRTVSLASQTSQEQRQLRRVILPRLRGLRGHPRSAKEAGMTRRKRRAFTPEFKAEAVRLAKAGDRSIKQVAKDLDLTETALRDWIKRADTDAGHGPPGALTTPEREELQRLRRDVKRLEME